MDIINLGTGHPAIVAVHGIQGTRASWLPVAQQDEGLARWVLPNLRGRGAAARGRGEADYTLSSFAAELGAVIDEAIGDAPYVLAGWSLGVSIALAFLSAQPRRPPRGAVLLSGSPCLAQVQWFQGEGQALLANVAAREIRMGLREAADHEAVAWTWRAISQTDQRPLLAHIATPARILHGVLDADCPVQHAHWLAEGLPHAQLATLEGAGHGLPSQHPAWVAAQIRAFIATLDQQRNTA